MTKNTLDITTVFGIAAILTKGNAENFQLFMNAFVMATQNAYTPYWQQGRNALTPDKIPYTPRLSVK